MSYEIYNLKYKWLRTQPKADLLARLLASKNALDEGIGIPVEADLLDIVPALVDPELDNGTKEAEIAAVRMASDIQKAMKTHGVWLNKTGRIAVIRAELSDE